MPSERQICGILGKHTAQNIGQCYRSFAPENFNVSKIVFPKGDPDVFARTMGR